VFNLVKAVQNCFKHATCCPITLILLITVCRPCICFIIITRQDPVMWWTDIIFCIKPGWHNSIEIWNVMSQTKVYCDHGNLLVTQKMVTRKCGNHGHTGNSQKYTV
jgi:hypothetical protein